MSGSNSNSESPYSESKPKPCFSHLPWFLKQQIVDNTDLITRLRLRKTSKTLIHLVDKSPFHIEKILIYLCNDGYALKIASDPEIMVVYSMSEDYGTYKYETGMFSVRCPDPVRRLVKDLAALLQSRTMIVDELMIGYNKDHKAYLTGAKYPLDRAVLNETFKEEFDKLPHQLNVDYLAVIVSSENDLMNFVPYLKPGVLKTLNLAVVNSDGVIQEVELARVKETEQWKQSETCKEEMNEE